MKRLIFILTMIFTTPAMAADFLDTQYGPDGVEVHLLKASVFNGVLTVAFMVENPTDQKIQMSSMGIDEALYTTQDMKFPVLKDTNGKYLASTITYDEGNVSGFLFAVAPDKYIDITIDPGGRKVGWLKFQSPPDDQWPIEVSLPGVTPFTVYSSSQ